MGIVSAIFFFSTVYFLWRRCAINLEAKGRGWLFRNWAGASIALTLGLFQTILLNGDGWISIGIGLALALGSIFIAGQPSTAAATQMSPSPEYKLSETAQAVSEAEPMPGDDPLVKPEIEAIRRESLAAMDRATKAREKEKKQEAVIEDPLVRWKETVSHDTYPEKAAAPGKRITHGARLDVVNFDYINAEGEFSTRRIMVTMAGEWQFEGIDLDIHTQRTFRYDRVVGVMTSELTGEVLLPDEWAVSIRGESFPTTAEDEPDDEEDVTTSGAESVEICFTGFTKADKLRLEGMAHSADMLVRQSVTVGLTHLVTGKKPGPKKLEQAEEVGAEVIDEAEFYVLFAES